MASPLYVCSYDFKHIFNLNTANIKNLKTVNLIKPFPNSEVILYFGSNNTDSDRDSTTGQMEVDFFPLQDDNVDQSLPEDSPIKLSNATNGDQFNHQHL